MGLYCRACGEVRPHSAFAPGRHKAHVCKVCDRLPREELAARLSHEELTRMEKQANLSGQNIRRLQVLVKAADAAAREKAEVLLQVARLHPHRSKRVPWLLERDPGLHARYVAAFEPDPVAPVEGGDAITP